jgi:site-specific recombinase XerD
MNSMDWYGVVLLNSPHCGGKPRAIQGCLGHRSITSTAVHTALAPKWFKDFWRD